MRVHGAIRMRIARISSHAATKGKIAIDVTASAHLRVVVAATARATLVGSVEAACHRLIFGVDDIAICATHQPNMNATTVRLIIVTRTIR